MLPVFIIWLILCCRGKRNSKKAISEPSHSKKGLPAIRNILVLIIVLYPIAAQSQNRVLKYQIIRSGTPVGTLLFSETSTNDGEYLKMESDVKARFIFSFVAHAREEAIYHHGVMFRSSIYRLLNGNEKVNKQHQENNGQYIIHAGQRSDVTKTYPITYNMLSFYSKEPENINRVYSDNFESFVDIQKTGLHRYKITLPDGNYNNYYYKNGVLALVEIHHSFYSANIVLTN
jgi:uncharacterized protein DUF6134